MTRVGGREVDEAHEMRARKACWEDCKAGKHVDPDAGCFTRCTDPRACQGWIPYLSQTGAAE